MVKVKRGVTAGLVILCVMLIAGLLVGCTRARENREIRVQCPTMYRDVDNPGRVPWRTDAKPEMEPENRKEE